MKLKFKYSCVYHGDRKPGEIVDFATVPPDAAIVIGAGLAEILTDEPENEPEPETAELPPLDVLESTDAASAETEPEEKPAKRTAKRKRK